MSTSSAAAARRAPLREEPRRLTEVVTTAAQRRARPKVLHALVAVAGLLAIVGAQLLLSIAVSGGAYQIANLQTQARALQRQTESLNEQIEIAGSTQALSVAAARLGMAPAVHPFFLRLSNGKAYAAPGFSNPLHCGGECNLVSNSLIAGLPVVLPASPDDTAVDTSADAAAGDATTGGTTDGTKASTDGAAGSGKGGSQAPEKVPDAPKGSTGIPGPLTH